jgi:hypothetical protein
MGDATEEDKDDAVYGFAGTQYNVMVATIDSVLCGRLYGNVDLIVHCDLPRMLASTH